MILIFHAFDRELKAFMKILGKRSAITAEGLAGYMAFEGETELALLSTGIGIERARRCAQLALQTFRNISLVIATGVAGALCEDLATGDLLLAEQLIIESPGEFTPERTIEVPQVHLSRLERLLRGNNFRLRTGALFTARRVLLDGPAKRCANRATGALAVDMESAAIAIEAAARDLPFACVRAILDRVDDELPGVRIADENGNVRAAAALGYLIKNPAAVLTLGRLRHDLGRASATLALALKAICRGANDYSPGSPEPPSGNQRR